MLKDVNLHYPIPSSFNYVHSHRQRQNTKLILITSYFQISRGNLFLHSERKNVDLDEEIDFPHQKTEI